MVKEAIFRSPHTPKRVLKALTRHPMIKTACEVNAPLSLSDTDRLLAARGVKRSRELAGIVGLALNVESAQHGTLHAAFFGRGGAENGLARSLLLFAACAAAEKRTTRPQPAPSPRPLTSREQQVLDRALTGRTDAEIAAALGIATRTVRFHLVNAMRRAGVTTRAQLIALAARANGAQHAS
jgi:DNA-binding CsgD family transcriptional regulator